jgi:hypothetical protein
MPIREILRAVVFLHRLADDRDFLRTVDCIPDSQMKVLEEELKIRQDEGEIETVQVGRMRYQAATLSVYQNGVDKFLDMIDEVRLHSSTDRTPESESGEDGSIPSGATNFTGFDDVTEIGK